MITVGHFLFMLTMKHLLLAAILQAFAYLTFGQCNEKESIAIFNQAQELDDEEAAPLFEKAASGFRKCQQFDNYLIAAYHSGVAYLNINNNDAAQSILEQAIADTYGKTDSTTSVNMLIYHTLGEVHYGKKDAHRAIFYYNKALQLLGSDDSEELAVCLFNAGNSYDMLANYDEAIGAHRKSIAMKERLEIADSSDYLQSFSALGDIYQAMGKTDSANFFFSKAREFVDVADCESKIYMQYKDALNAINNNDYASAYYLFAEAKSLCEVSNLRNNIYVSSCMYLAHIYERNDNTKKAMGVLLSALQTNPDKDETYYNILLAYGRMDEDVNVSAAKLHEIINNTSNNELKCLAQLELAKKHEQKGNLQSAFDIYSQVAENINKDSHPEISAQATYGIGNIYFLKNDFEKALTEYAVAQKVIANKDKELSAVISEALGNVYFKMNSLSLALAQYEQAFSLLKQQLGATNFRTLSAEENIAAIDALNLDFEKAAEIYNRSLTTKQTLYDATDARMFDLYNSYANVLCSMANYQEAGTLYQKAQRILETQTLTESAKDIFYNNHGLYCKSIGDYKQALTDMLNSLNIKSKLYGENSLKYANTLNNLGTIYMRLANYNKAGECFEQAEVIIVGASGEQSLALSEVFINQGNLYNRLGQNELALDYYNKALNIKSDNGNDDDKDLAPIYNNMGTVHQNTEDYRLALFFFKKALNTYTKHNGYNSQETAESYNNIGNTLLKTGQIDEAIGNYRKATDIYAQFPDINPTLPGNAYNNIATAYLQSGKLDSALVFYNQSLDIYYKVFGHQHPYLALIHNSIGDVNILLGNHAQAIECYGKAIEANHENFNRQTDVLPNKSGFYDQNIFVNSLLSRATAYTQQYLQNKNSEALTTALKHFQLCDELIVSMRRSAITQTDKMNLGAIAAKCYEGALEICTEMLNGNLSGEQRKLYEQQAFTYIEKSKSNSLLESMAGQDAMQLANIPTELQKKESQLSANVLYFEKLLAEKPRNSAQIRDSLFSANRAYDSFIKQLEQKFPEYHQLKYASNIVDLRQLQSKLTDGTMVRMYLIGKDMIYAACISGNQFNVSSAPNYKNLTDTVKVYRNAMIQSSQKAVTDYGRLARMLYKTLFPDTIANISNLVIIPDGALNQIPFESLISEDINGSVYDYTNYSFLIKSFAISYAYSATLYYRDITRPQDNGASGWLGMAPVFTKGKYSGVELNSKWKKKELNHTDLIVVENSKLAPLVSSEPEIRNIFAMFTKAGIPAKAYLWGSANRQNFSNDSITQTKYIHLATHGFVNSERPELSGVQLSPLQGDDQKGMLYSNEVYGMKLKCDLLILSACETGLGKIMKGEGIVGLSRAFLYAGASNLIVSLWKVSDNSTSQMMVEFYKQMLAPENANLNYAELLQKAKHSLINDKSYSRPYYWAPFIVIGD